MKVSLSWFSISYTSLIFAELFIIWLDKLAYGVILSVYFYLLLIRQYFDTLISGMECLNNHYCLVSLWRIGVLYFKNNSNIPIIMTIK
jgi:hypothetical protein